MNAQLILVAAKNVVLSHRQVKQTAWLYSLRIVIVIFDSGLWDLHVDRSESCCAACPQRGPERTRSGELAIASEPGLKFLVGGQRQPGDGVHQRHLAAWNGGPSAVRDRRRSETGCGRSGAWHGAGHQPAVVSPVEGEPRPALPWLVLHMRRL